MSPLALALVFTAALLHASWNLVAKQAGGGNHFTFLAAAFVGLLWAPVAIWAGIGAVGRFGLAEWSVLAASAVVHLLYFGYDMT
jgi:hypothetical protein